MSLLKIARLGHPAVRASSDVMTAGECAHDQFQEFVDNLIDTMRDAHGVGIAAPQVHVLKQVIAVEIDPKNPRYPGYPNVPLMVLINPKIVDHAEDTQEDWEGCLSVPDLRGRVPRWTSITIEAIDRQGKSVSFTADGFFARVLQHEIDHLQGKVFIDRLRDLTTLTHLREYDQFWRSDE